MFKFNKYSLDFLAKKLCCKNTDKKVSGLSAVDTPLLKINFNVKNF